jgi:hypothetical protein
MTNAQYDDFIIAATYKFYLREVAIVRRMLQQWDPTWGEPELIRQDRYVPPKQLDNGMIEMTSNLVGLARATPEGDKPVILVQAAAQLDAEGNILPDVEDKGMLAQYEGALKGKRQ